MARDKGDGSLRKLSSGHWEGRVSYRDAAGERKYKQVTGRTHAIAKEKLDKLIEQIEHEKELAADPNYVPANNYLFSDWLDVWHGEILPNTARPGTLDSYYRNIEKHIKPALGNLYLQQLRSVDIQALINKMNKSGEYMPWTINKVKNVISGALTAATEQTPPLIAVNPCRGVKTPPIKQRPIRVLTEEEQKVFMEAVKGSRFETLFLFALATGMRRGEMVALTWDRVDFSKAQITVNSSVSRVLDMDTKRTQLMEGEPKSDAGSRKVPLLPGIAPVLLAHKKEQDAIRKAAGSAWNERNLVFCSAVGEWIEPRRIQLELHRILRGNDMEPFGVHTFRHTFATRMLEREVSPKVVSEILGHADVKTTMQIYTHVFDSTAQEQAYKLNSLFAGLTNEDAPRREQAASTHYPEFKRQNTKARNRAAKSKTGKKKKGGDAR
jgi:integrase